MLVSADWGNLFKWLASEYGWTPSVIRELTPAQVTAHLEDNRAKAPHNVVARRMRDKHGRKDQ